MKATASTYITDSSQPIEVVLVKRHERGNEFNPNIGLYDYVVLRDGPQAYKVASQWIGKDARTGRLNEQTVKIDTFRRFPRAGWHLDEKHSIRLHGGDASNEIEKLATFLGAVCSDKIPAFGGSYLVVPVENGIDTPALRELLSEVSSQDTAELLTKILSITGRDKKMLESLAARASLDPKASKEAAAVLNIARYSAALRKLETLIETNAKEGAFQTLLTENPWMFGSEYSQLLSRRNYTRDEKQDFVLRRTVDGYLEIIEIKTPLNGEPLFRKDESHDTYFQRSELSMVLGQVLKYLEQLDADQYSIQAKDNEKVTKIRAKIIIGCTNGDANQVAALRRFNGHLHRVEVITYDQLANIARQVIAHLKSILDPAQEEETSA